MGGKRNGPAGEVLPADQRRQEATRKRDRQLEAPFDGHQPCCRGSVRPMRWFHKLRTQLATLRRSRAGTQLDTELRFHLDQQIEENLAAGMNAEEARRAAIQSFGHLGTIQEETRSAWSWSSV